MLMNAKQRCVDNPILSDLCADDVEQALVRALVRLMCQDQNPDNSRPVVVMRLGSLDVHLSKTPPDYATFGLPPFWIEVIDAPTQTSVDSLGFRDFDEDELAAAVEMIVSAAHDAGRSNVPPPRGPTA